MENLWYGYVHVNGSLHVKRFFDQGDIDECNESPLVKSVYGPWPALNRVDAEAKLRAEL